LDLFFYFVEDEVEQLVISLEYARDFTPAGKLDSDAGIDVLG